MTTSSESTFLDLETPQERRVWALQHAKRVLAKTPFGSGELSTVEMIDLATFILTGEDPYVGGQGNRVV